MPQIIQIEKTGRYAKYALEPLERGYGQTLGNSLRRVLLSSIQGAAITAIRIDKVFHEFSSIPGVKEDATELILNLKDLAIRFTGDALSAEEVVLQIDSKGPGKVTGADVICPPDCQIVNPEAYIATISDPEAVLKVELIASWGQGYVLPDKHEKYKGIIGVIAVGSQFTPVTKVNYIVEQTRVANRTDYERLVLEVTTNGSVTPNDAITQAAVILDKYYRMFFDLGQAGLDFEASSLPAAGADLSSVPDLRIDELGFEKRTFNCLKRSGLLTLRQLVQTSESELSALKGLGKKALIEIREKMAEHGIELKRATGTLHIFTDEDEGLGE